MNKLERWRGYRNALDDVTSCNWLLKSSKVEQNTKAFHRKVFLPISGGIDSMAILYSMACCSIWTPENSDRLARDIRTEYIKLINIVDEPVALSSRFDRDWIEEFVKTKEFELLKTIIEFTQCCPYEEKSISKCRTTDRVNVLNITRSVTDIITGKVSSSLNTMTNSSSFHQNSTYMQLSVIPNIMSFLGSQDTVLFGILKGESEEVGVDFKSAEKYMNMFMDNTQVSHIQKSIGPNTGESFWVKSHNKLALPFINYNKFEVTSLLRSLAPREVFYNLNLFVFNKNKTNPKEHKYKRFLEDDEYIRMNISKDDKRNYIHDWLTDMNRKGRKVLTIFKEVAGLVNKRKHKDALRLLAHRRCWLLEHTSLNNTIVDMFMLNIIRDAVVTTKMRKFKYGRRYIDSLILIYKHSVDKDEKQVHIKELISALKCTERRKLLEMK